MFAADQEAIRLFLDYCATRLSLPDVPLDFGSRQAPRPELLDGLISATGNSPDAVLELFANHLAPAVVSSDSERFLAFIPSAPTKASVLFDMVIAASALNGTSWLEAAGAVVAENQALRFLADLAGLGPRAGGAFVSGGSAGNLAALAVARDQGRLKRPDVAPHQLRVAISADAHSSIGQALHILGISPLLVPTVDHRLTASALRAALAADPDSVIAIAATAGTTNLGIVDDLAGLSVVAAERNLWLHVDGAYGLAALLSSERDKFAGIEHADSFIVDPHKWLFAPLDCCALLYKDPEKARATHTQEAGYLDVVHSGSPADEWNPADYAIHLSRRPRGLPFWFSLVVNGVDAYRAAVQSSIDLTIAAADLIDQHSEVELLRDPALSVVIFRVRGFCADEYREWSNYLLDHQIALVTPTVYEEETVARLVFLHPDTTIDIVHEILDSIAPFRYHARVDSSNLGATNVTPQPTRSRYLA